MDIKAGMGVGTTFRVIGDFSGKRLEWDCETTEFVREEKISAKMIKGKFCLLYTSPSPRDATLSRMPSSA